MTTTSYWERIPDELQTVDAGFADAARDFVGRMLGATALDEGSIELLCLAVNASTTHLNPDAVRHHVRRALELGIPVSQIMEIFELVSILGMHTCTTGVPILLEELRAAGRADILDAPLTDRQIQLKASFVEARGFWTDMEDGVVLLAPDFFEAFTNFSSVPWRSGTLPPKIREFVYVAIDSDVTHVYEPGIQIHVTNALRLGATKEEILSVFALVSLMGLQGAAAGMAILAKIGEGMTDAAH